MVSTFNMFQLWFRKQKYWTPSDISNLNHFAECEHTLKCLAAGWLQAASGSHHACLYYLQKKQSQKASTKGIGERKPEESVLLNPHLSVIYHVSSCFQSV